MAGSRSLGGDAGEIDDDALPPVGVEIFFIDLLEKCSDKLLELIYFIN